MAAVNIVYGHGGRNKYYEKIKVIINAYRLLPIDLEVIKFVD